MYSYRVRWFLPKTRHPTHLLHPLLSRDGCLPVARGCKTRISSQYVARWAGVTQGWGPCSSPAPCDLALGAHWSCAAFLFASPHSIWCKKEGWGQCREWGCRAGETPMVFTTKLLGACEAPLPWIAQWKRWHFAGWGLPEHMSFEAICTAVVLYVQKGTNTSLQRFAGEGNDLSPDLILTEADDEKTVCWVGVFLWIPTVVKAEL